jgi:hypothetical protein
MKYVPPFGREAEGDDAHYVNGNPSAGIQGSIPDAKSWEHPLREIVGVIETSKIVPSESDLLQLAKSVRSQRSNFADDTGSVNTLSVAYDPPLTAYTLGLPLHVRVHQTNTGASSIDAGAGRVNIVRSDGNSVSSGDLPAGGIVDMIYDGTSFQLVNFLGAGGAGSIINNYSNVPYVVDTSGTPNIITANFAPAITTLSAGTIFMVKIANTNNADSVINVNAIPSKAIRANSGGKLLPGDVAAGDVKLFVYDGTNFYIEPNPLIGADVSILVPSQFTTPQLACNALSRKTIAETAMVTIQIAVGIFGPFVLTHKDADRITIKGTMLATAPTNANFAQSGSSPAQRAADAANNITMLRSRYGTEIQFTVTDKRGFENRGPGCPFLKDLLITSNRATGTYGLMNDFNGSPSQQSFTANNVAIWGCQIGAFAGGRLSFDHCSVTNCQIGVWAMNIGAAAVTYCQVHGCDQYGLLSTNHGEVTVVGSDVMVHGLYGAYAGDMSYIGISDTNTYNNGTLDVYATLASVVRIGGGGTQYTFSPPINTVGNYNSIIQK